MEHFPSTKELVPRFANMKNLSYETQLLRLVHHRSTQPRLDLASHSRTHISCKTTQADTQCKRKCVPQDAHRRARATKKMIQKMQTSQSQINGYFGGYISKRQKLGKMETRKCVDKMYLLRQKQGNKSEKEGCSKEVTWAKKGNHHCVLLASF